MAFLLGSALSLSATLWAALKHSLSTMACLTAASGTCYVSSALAPCDGDDFCMLIGGDTALLNFLRT
eukprot:1033264-Amphidinium_carterae.1